MKFSNSFAAVIAAIVIVQAKKDDGRLAKFRDRDSPLSTRLGGDGRGRERDSSDRSKGGQNNKNFMELGETCAQISLTIDTLQAEVDALINEITEPLRFVSSVAQTLELIGVVDLDPVAALISSLATDVEQIRNLVDAIEGVEAQIESTQAQAEEVQAQFQEEFAAIEDTGILEFVPEGLQPCVELAESV